MPTTTWATSCSKKTFPRPAEVPSLKSKLLEFLAADKVHKAIKVDEEEFERLYTWMDTYGHTQGSFSPEQEAELVEFKKRCRFLFERGRSSGSSGQATIHRLRTPAAGKSPLAPRSFPWPHAGLYWGGWGPRTEHNRGGQDMRQRTIIAALAVVYVVLVAGAGKAADFYVATDGNDRWSGRLAAPSPGGGDGPFCHSWKGQGTQSGGRRSRGCGNPSMSWFGAGRTTCRRFN